MDKKLNKLKAIKYYLRDFLYDLNEEVVDAKKEYDTAPEDKFKEGILHGNLKTLALFNNKALARNILLGDENLLFDDKDTEKELNKCNAAKKYLLEVIDQVKDYAVNAEKRRRKNRMNRFNSGKAIAILTKISMMQNKAIAFNIPLKQLHLDDIDPEGDPLGENKKNA